MRKLFVLVAVLALASCASTLDPVATAQNERNTRQLVAENEQLADVLLDTTDVVRANVEAHPGDAGAKKLLEAVMEKVEEESRNASRIRNESAVRLAAAMAAAK
jgi:hypothetical protein